MYNPEQKVRIKYDFAKRSGNKQVLCYLVHDEFFSVCLKCTSRDTVDFWQLCGELASYFIACFSASFPLKYKKIGILAMHSIVCICNLLVFFFLQAHVLCLNISVFYLLWGIV
jgi:hypothetical protein